MKINKKIIRQNLIGAITNQKRDNSMHTFIRSCFVLLLISAPSFLITSCGEDDSDPAPDAIVVTANDFTATIAENPVSGAILGTVDASTTDANNSLSYTIVSQNPSGALEMDRNTGEISVSNEALFDFETITTVTSTYRASSGNVNDEGTITITITDVEEGEPVTITTNDFATTIDENPTMGFSLGTVSVSTSDGSILTFSLTTQSVTGALSIDNNTGELTVADSSVFDFEMNPTIAATYQASGTADNLEISETGTITITVNDVDETTSSAFIFEWSPVAFQGDLIGFIGGAEQIGTDVLVYNYTVDWGDGTLEETFTEPGATHIYERGGTYQVSITGELPHIQIGDPQIRSALREIIQWGDIEWKHFQSSFAFNQDLVISAQDTPNLSNVGSMASMFEGCFNFNSGNFNQWDVSNVTSMNSMFERCFAFNQNLSSWDVGNVIDMWDMFRDASSFNQDISGWDVSNVTGMLNMFVGAAVFSQDISQWDVSNVEIMGGMFINADSFNQDISGWDVSKVRDMRQMFQRNDAFNQDLSGWNVSSVTMCDDFADEATSFNANNWPNFTNCNP